MVAGALLASDGNPSPPVDLTTLPIEALMDIEVTILKGHNTLSDSPAAISVLTQEEIRRSGALTIPEALRLVPGLQVARVDASQWAVSSRGFNDLFANKLLVLQDGRTIYSPLFSGVFWDAQGTMMEDIDRIEVIRGPGASLWGANAVNGVINIITKSAKETQGTLVSAGGGTEKQALASARYGGELSPNAWFRVYATYLDHDASVLPDGTAANDSWRMGRVGFRIDWDASEGSLLTLQGDAYAGGVHETFGTYDPGNPPTYFTLVADEMQVRGGNLLGRWTRTFSPAAELKLQIYYDRTERDAAIFEETRDTVDLDLQHRFDLGDWNTMMWGVGYRVSADEIGSSPTTTFTPSSRTSHLVSGFVQDEVTLLRDRLKAILGTKLEHNDFTGFEIQPGGRLLWTPHEAHTIWASISRAVRTPARSDEDVRFNQVVAPAVVSSISGNRDFESESVLAYEAGYRVQPHRSVSLDLAAFYNEYDNLRTAELVLAPPPPPPPFFIPGQLDNQMYGETYGIEASGTWEVTRWWRLRPSYTFLQMQLHRRAGSTDPVAEQEEGKNPHHQFALRSSLDLPRNVFVDCSVRYVDSLPAFGIDNYVSLDARLAWRPSAHLELAIVGQDLLDNRHPEFAPSFVNTQQTEVPRSVYGKITWHF